MKIQKMLKLSRTMFGSTNKVMGTSYRSRIDNPKYQFAGKTGTAQVKKITEKDRELDLKTFEIPYEDRDHALYIAFGPYKNQDMHLVLLNMEETEALQLHQWQKNYLNQLLIGTY